MLKFNADLYRLATICQSHEETRYYLNGVNVEPCPQGGVLLVATDGRRMVCIHDENGHADETAIIQLSRDALKSCKLKKGEDRRTITVDGTTATVTAYVGNDPDEAGERIAISERCKVDGTFPDYRRVVPIVSYNEHSRPGAFNGRYLGDFGKIAAGLAPYRKTETIRVMSFEPLSPALIMFPGAPNAFGVLMPIRGVDLTECVPEWFNNKPAFEPTQ